MGCGTSSMGTTNFYLFPTTRCYRYAPSESFHDRLRNSSATSRKLRSQRQRRLRLYPKTSPRILNKGASLREWACQYQPFSKEMRPMSKAITTSKVDYFSLPRPLWRKLKKHLPKSRKSTVRGGRPRASDRAVINAIWYVLWSGCQWKALHREWFGVSSSVVHERFQRWRRMGIFEKLMRRMAEHYARKRGGVGWKWQAMDSKHSPAPLGGGKTGKNPTDRGKRGAKINLLVDERGAPISVVLTGANRHDTRSP